MAPRQKAKPASTHGILVAPNEPPLFRAAGVVSAVPERYGVDMLWAVPGVGLCGVQRKEIKDLLASVADGRLAREVSMMRPLVYVSVMIEGRMRWSLDGELMEDWTRWTRVQHRNLCRSLMAKGIWVEHTDGLGDTIASVEAMKTWTEKRDHRGLETRPKPAGTWGQYTDADFGVHILQSVDGIGPGQARGIIEHFGGLPLRWTVTREEMAKVKGLGKVRVEKLFKAIQSGQEPDREPG